MKSTKQDFDRFVAHCKWWLKELSLGDYSFAFQTDEADGEYAAYICPNSEAKLISVFLVKEDPCFSIPFLARHEMLEVLVEEMGCELRNFLSDKRCYKMGHTLIHRLEKVLPLPTDKEVGIMPCGKKKKPKGK